MGYGKITAKQQEILDYIKDEILKRGYPPTVREICETVNLKSTSSVHSHLETLEKNGYIRRDPTKPRAIEICDDSFQMVRTEMVSLPVIGNVAAGQPILAEENIQDYFPVPADVVPKGESFILNVRGESMINAGIFNGDRVFVHAQNTAHNGEIVVALIDDSATVKTFYKEKGHIRLQPENDTMDPIIVDDCQILGTVFGVFRFYKQLDHFAIILYLIFYNGIKKIPLYLYRGILNSKKLQFYEIIYTLCNLSDITPLGIVPSYKK